MTAAALGATVPTAHPHVLEHADRTSTQPAGAGAVRELIDLTLTTQGHPITDLRPQPNPAAQMRLRAGGDCKYNGVTPTEE